MPSLRDLGEFGAIRLLAHGLREGPGVVIGSGDDAAVLRVAPGRDLVVTTDAFVEGRHWLPEWIDPATLGARLAAANLSDVAAMAAVPRWAVLAIGARAGHDAQALATLQEGLARGLADHGATLVGGNLAAVEGGEWLALTLLGEVERGRAWTRSAARPGDLLVVTGFPGRAGAGARLARALGEAARGDEWRALLAAWLRPAPRVAAAQALLATGAVTAAIDVSDGLLGDLAHLCEASGVGAEIRAEPGTADPWLARAADTLGVSAFDLWVGPSDDYELLLAVDPAQRARCEQAAGAAGATLAFIGRFTDARGAIACLEGDGSRRVLGSAGFDHFARG
jgi:thiamine-monophosphate kinase